MSVQQKPIATARPASFDVGTFNQFEHDGWERVGEDWHRHFNAVSAQAVSHLLDAVWPTDASRPARLLDVATGPGYGAGAAAERGATATGIDFADAQIAVARRLFPAAEFQVGDAGALPFGERDFDAVIMNFGLLHFPDPERALAESFRVLRPGGQIAFTVWASPEKTRGFGIVEEAIARHGDAEASIPDGPAYFRFADPAEAARGLRGAGFAAPSSRNIDLTWTLDDPADLIPAVANGTVRAGAKLRAQPAAARAEVEAAIVRSASAYRRNGRIELPMGIVLSSATKP